MGQLTLFRRLLYGVCRVLKHQNQIWRFFLSLSSNSILHPFLPTNLSCFSLLSIMADLHRQQSDISSMMPFEKTVPKKTSRFASQVANSHARTVAAVSASAPPIPKEVENFKTYFVSFTSFSSRRTRALGGQQKHARL